MMSSPCGDCCDTGVSCGPCEIFFDDFSGDLSGWTEVSGDWVIASEILTTSDSNAVLKSNLDHPYGIASSVVTATLLGTAVDDTLLVIVAFYSPIEYLAARVILKEECGILELIQTDGASTNSLGFIIVPGLVPNMRHTIKVCYTHTDGPYGEEGILSAVITPAGFPSILIVAEDVFSDGIKVGLGTDSITSHVEFDNFCWRRHKTIEDIDAYTPAEPTCPECPTTAQTCNWGSLSCPLDCTWTADAGTWDCNVTSDANARLIYANPHPYNDVQHRVLGRITATDDGCEAIFFVNYLNSSNYLAGRLTIHDSCGKLELINSGIVLDSINIEPCTTGQSHFLCVSFDGQVLSAHAGTLVTSMSTAKDHVYRHLRYETAGHATGVNVGIGTGANPGTITFNDVTITTPYSDKYPDCDSCNTCFLSNTNDTDVTVGCEWGISGSVTNGANGPIIATAGSYATYKGNDGSDDAYLSVEFIATVSGQVIRVYVNDDGTATGPYAEIDVSSSFGVTKFKLSTGQEIFFNAEPGETYKVTLCLNGTSLQANIDHPASDTFASLVGTLGSPVTGQFATVKLQTTNGTVTFNNLTYERNSVERHMGLFRSDECQGCRAPCTCCAGGSMPSEILLTIPNIELSGKIIYEENGDLLDCVTDFLNYGTIYRSQYLGNYILQANLNCVYISVYQKEFIVSGDPEAEPVCLTIQLNGQFYCGSLPVGICLPITPGKVRFLLNVQLRWNFDCNLITGAVLLNAWYYSDEIDPEDCMTMDSQTLHPYSWDSVADPDCAISTGHCHAFGIFTGTAWTSSHSIHATAL